jgi:hypothetical protein
MGSPPADFKSPRIRFEYYQAVPVRRCLCLNLLAYLPPCPDVSRVVPTRMLPEMLLGSGTGTARSCRGECSTQESRPARRPVDMLEEPTGGLWT